jgi:molybdopterin/thiamine biosynthesis adenylyltransferase/ubiquitin-protein ligase
MKWALIDPKRLTHEHLQLEELSAAAEWITASHWRISESFQLEVDIDLLIHGRTYKATLTYPDAFPNTPAYIRPRDRSELWSGHQYGEGGSLCLEWRADNWHPEVTGADLVRSAYKLLSTEHDPESPAPVQSAHRTTRGQELSGKTHRLIATPVLLECLAKLPANSSVPIQTETIFHQSARVSIVTEIGNEAGERTRIADVPIGVGGLLSLWSWSGDGFAVCSEGFHSSSAITSVETLSELVQSAGLSAEMLLAGVPESTKLQSRIVLIKGSDASAFRAFAINDANFIECAVILPSGHDGRRPSSHFQLEGTRVAIVGLGSMGSKIAVSLARSGVRKFLLIDDDVFLPENMSRNELGWDAVGLHKADAVQEKLALISAGIETRVQVRRLVAQESSLNMAAVLKSLAACDLIIDASANSDVFLQLAAIARMNRRALVWGEVFAGGIGGLIARSSPNRDPHPLAVKSGILRHFETLPPAPYMNATGYDVQDETPIVADDADVTHIASALTRLVIDTALDQQTGGFDSQAYLIGLRREWVFSGPFDTQPIQVAGEDWDEAPSSPEDQEAAAQIWGQILQERSDDQIDSATADPRDN